MPDQAELLRRLRGAGGADGPERDSRGWRPLRQRLEALACKRVMTDQPGLRAGQADGAGPSAAAAGGSVRRAAGPEAAAVRGPGGVPGRHEPPEGAGPGLCHGPE